MNFDVRAYKGNKGTLDKELDNEMVLYTDVEWHRDGIMLLVHTKSLGWGQCHEVLSDDDAVYLAAKLLAAVTKRSL